MYFTISTNIQNAVFTRFLPPKAELAAAESVTIELAEAVSIRARLYFIFQIKPNPVAVFSKCVQGILICHSQSSGAHSVTNHKNDVLGCLLLTELDFALPANKPIGFIVRNPESTAVPFRNLRLSIL